MYMYVYTVHIIYIIIFLCVSMFIFQTVCTQGDDGSSEAVEMRSTLQHYIHDIMTLRRERREREADKYRLLQVILRSRDTLLCLDHLYT